MMRVILPPESIKKQEMNMSRFIVMMVAIMMMAANALAQNNAGQVEEKQDSAALSVNDTIALKDV